MNIYSRDCVNIIELRQVVDNHRAGIFRSQVEEDACFCVLIDVGSIVSKAGYQHITQKLANDTVLVSDCHRSESSVIDPTLRLHLNEVYSVLSHHLTNSFVRIMSPDQITRGS